MRANRNAGHCPCTDRYPHIAPNFQSYQPAHANPHPYSHAHPHARPGFTYADVHSHARGRATIRLDLVYLPEHRR